jgi:hypothetical protein
MPLHDFERRRIARQAVEHDVRNLGKTLKDFHAGADLQKIWSPK